MQQFKISRFIRNNLARNSFFVKVALILFGLFLAIVSAFFVFVIRTEEKNLQKSIDVVNVDILKTASTTTEMVLEDLSQTIHQTLWDKDFTGAIINSDRSDYERTMRILTKLNDLASGYSCVDQAMLYSVTGEILYSSNQSMMRVEADSDSLIQKILQTDADNKQHVGESVNAPFLIQQDGQIFLCETLYPEYIRSIGMLMFRLDLSSLGLQESENQEQSGCFVFTAEGNSLLAQQLPQEVIELVGKTQLETLPESGSLMGEKNARYYYYCSRKTGWIYISPAMGAVAAHVPNLSMLLLLFAAALLGGMLLSLALARHINRPIRTLLGEVTENEEGFAGSEIEYLTRTYHDTFQKNAELTQAISDITPMALERLFSDILSNRTPDMADIQEMFQSLNQPLPDGTKFLVMVAEMAGQDEQPLSAAQSNLCLVVIRQNLQKSCYEGVQVFLIPRDNSYAALVLVFEPGIQEKSIREIATDLRRQLENIKSNTPFQLLLGCGNIYAAVNNLCYSYKDAQEQLNRRRFFGETAINDPVQSAWFEEARYIVRRIQLADEQGAQNYITQQINKLIQEEKNSYEVADYCAKFSDCYLNIAQTLDMGNVDDIRLLQKTMLESIRQAAQPHQQLEMFQRFMLRSVDILGNRTRSKSSWHIERIRDFIRTNYANSSLSLNQAAEHIGISPSYLSRLFRQEIGASFVDYVNNVRVEEAKKLLRTTDKIIRDIAFDTGFNSEQNFYRIFKKRTNLSPGEYRNRQNR